MKTKNATTYWLICKNNEIQEVSVLTPINPKRNTSGKLVESLATFLKSRPNVIKINKRKNAERIIDNIPISDLLC